MSAAALNAARLSPRSADGLVPGASLALVVHVALVSALALGVDWRRHSDAVPSAELWSALPQVAAPRAPRPEPSPAPPPPPAPAPAPLPAPARSAVEIAIEKEKLAQAEREARLAQQREAQARRAREAEQAALNQQRELQRKRQEEQARQAEEAKEQARLDKQRKDNLERMLAQAGGTGAPSSTGTAARDAAPSQAYQGILRSFLRDKIVMTDRDRLPRTLETIVEIRATTSGTVLSRRLIKSSGNAEWDEAVLRAIDKIDKLPRDTDGRAPTSFQANFKPFD